MYIAIDMRPWAENLPEKGDFFSEELLHAFFRNHPSDIFILWTTGNHELPEHLLFDEYNNTRVLHTATSSHNISFYTDWFSGIEIDDMVETEAMKQGMMPWIERIGIAFFSSFQPWKTEENCFSVQMVNSLSFLHSSNTLGKYYQSKNVRKIFSQANMVVVPSMFSLQECQYLTNIPTEKIFLSSIGISKEIIPTPHSSENDIWKSLPEHFFLVRAEDPSGAMVALKAFELFKTRFPESNWEMIIEEPTAGSLHFLYDKREKLHILAPLSQAHHQSVLQKAGVFIDTSQNDAIGFSVLQALRYEIPCIVSNFGALPEIASTNALFFDPTKSTELYTQMKLIIENPEMRQEMKEKGRIRSRDARFFIDDIAMAILDEAKKRKGA